MLIAPDILLRNIPEDLLAGVASGDLQVFGGIIRSISSGRIVAHLQETSGMASLASEVVKGAASFGLQPASIAVDVVGHATSFIQNEQIKAAIGVVQTLQIASLALGVIGVGVSVAGFTIMAQKIARVEAKLDTFGTSFVRLESKIDGLKEQPIREDFVGLQSIAQQMDEGWLLNNPETQWRDVARAAHAIANAFERRAIDILDASENDRLLALPFIEACAIAGAVRVSARLASGDDLAGRQAAEENAKAVIGMVNYLDIAELVQHEVAAADIAAGSPIWSEKLESITSEIRIRVESVRNLEAGAVTLPETLNELDHRSIKGRDWLETARFEQDEPLLYLKTGLS